MHEISSNQSIQFSYQINLFENSYNIFDTVLLGDLNETINKPALIRRFSTIVNRSSQNILEAIKDFDQIPDDELMNELEYAISEYTNNPVEILVVLLLLVAKLSEEFDEAKLEVRNLSLLFIAKQLIEANYNMQLDLDMQSLAA